MRWQALYMHYWFSQVIAWLFIFAFALLKYCFMSSGQLAECENNATFDW
jgi:hypothetical protein